MTPLLKAGRLDATVMTKGPDPGMLKVMTSAPPLAFASRIACRSEPGPESFVLVTTKVAAEALPDTRRALASVRAAILAFGRGVAVLRLKLKEFTKIPRHGRTRRSTVEPPYRYLRPQATTRTGALAHYAKCVWMRCAERVPVRTRSVDRDVVVPFTEIA